jgi:hypothetical protein
MKPAAAQRRGSRRQRRRQYQAIARAFRWTKILSAQILVLLIMTRRIPDLRLYVGGTHVHHLNYGIILLSVVGTLALLTEQKVQAAINSASTYLPKDLPNPPIYSKSNPTDAPILTLALTSETAGSGGQAEVFRVVDPELGRTLILKLSRAAVRGDQRDRDAILAEGQLLAEFDHPNIVRIFDVGFHHGRRYLVMEHVYGQNLEQLYETARPTWRQATRLMTAVARVIAFAHRRGIVHGDITPRNILIDQDGRPRMIDFGMARIRDAWQERVKTSGGTVGFLAPEVARGDSHRSDARCDVFSLGATLYWLLTGVAPFAAPTLEESIDRARRCDFDRDALAQTRAPRRLGRAVLHAMAPLPTDPASADRWADQLDHATAPWKHPTVRVAAPLAALLLVAGLIWWSPWRASKIQSQGQATPADDNEPASVPFAVAAPEMTILRGEQVLALEAALPLRAGDRIALTFEVPKGTKAHLLWYDAAGRLYRLPTAVTHTPTTDRYAYPGFGQRAPLEPPAGTQLFLLCAGARLIDEEIQGSFPIPVPLHRLPPRAYLKINGTKIEVAGAHHGDADADALETSEEQLQRICALLRKRFAAAVIGYALPQADASTGGPN